MLEKQLRFHVVQFRLNHYVDGVYDPDLALQNWLNENIPVNATVIKLECLREYYYRVVYEIKQGRIG
jgi:hypothetical protein